MVAEFVKPLLEESDERQDIDEKLGGMVSTREPLTWKIDVDGASNQRGSEVGLIIISPDKIIIEKSLRLGFSAIKNETEYEDPLVE